MRDDDARLLDALGAIDPCGLDYNDWCAVGMALHESGHGWQEWDDWSRRDAARYHEGECESKWRSFGNSAERVTAGTIIHMAEMRGWRQPTSGMGEALDWDGTGIVQAGPDALSADAQPIEDADEGDWNPCGMLSDYLAALFDDDDIVGYVVNCWEQDGELKPKRGDWSRTAGELRQELARPGATMDKVLGSWDERAGAWIRFNPLDGHGRDADTVLDFSLLFVPDELWQKFDRKPLYRAEITCRGFGPRKPIDCAFRYPRFYRDTSGTLAQCKILGEDPGAEGRAKGAQATKDNARDAGRNRLLALNDAFENSPTDDFPDAVEFDEDFVASIRWGAFGIKDSPALATVSTWVKGTSKAKFVPTIQEHFELMQARSKTYLRRLKEPENDSK